MKQSKELQELKEVLLALEDDHVSKVLDILIKCEDEPNVTEVQATIDASYKFCDAHKSDHFKLYRGGKDERN